MGIQTATFVDYVFEQLRDDIIEGSYQADQKLVISNLAILFGVSTIPIREALAKLNTLGLVTFTPNRGYRIAAELTKKELIDLFEMRLALDLASAPGVIRHVSESDINELKRLNEKMSNRYTTKRYAQFQNFMKLNSEFHRKLVAIAGNSFLTKLYNDLQFEMFVSRHIINVNIEFSDFVHGHEEIITALEQRDEKALSNTLIDHLNNGINLTFGNGENIQLNTPA